ncbi:MAG: diguanylate cyclase [Planctomycetaceae bacterium]|nr:diguanylate cyclase [Planctomycetaceae bacterium]
MTLAVDIPSVAYWWAACALLCCIWLLREYVWRHRTVARDEQIDAIRKDLHHLQESYSQAAFQQEWLSRLVDGESSAEELALLVARWLPHDAQPQLWVMERSEDGTAAQLTVAAGNRAMLTRVTVSPQLWDQLEINGRVQLGEHELRHQRLLRLPSELARIVPELFVLRCGEQVPVNRILCTTHIPEWTGDRAENLRLLSWATQRWVTAVPVPANVAERIEEGENRMVRIMLELRTIADMEFASPMEMLREFLRILAKATGFDRVSLYLTQQDNSRKIDRFCWAGTGQEGDALDAWHQIEDSVVADHLDVSGLVVLTHDRNTHWANIGQVESIAITPLAPGNDPVGLLCLTSRSAINLGEVDRQIINWAARYLMQTLSRTVDRVVVEEQARRDSLTKLANRHTFDHEMARQLQVSGSLDEFCSLILIDLDHFKKVNDEFGHPAGDAVLQEVALRLESEVGKTRVTDRPLVARLGGEELGVLLPGVGYSGANRIAEALRESIRSTPVVHEGLTIPVTASLGIAICPRNGREPRELFAAADAALYAAKASGRDCVRTAPAISASGARNDDDSP